MISLDQILEIHDVLIEKFGGSRGVRDRSLLESSYYRPLSTFDSVDLYPGPIEKAAAILESIVKNHPFVDGNKRTGYVLMRLYLMREGHDIIAREDEKYDFVIGVAEGKLSMDEIVAWVQERAVIVN